MQIIINSFIILFFVLFLISLGIFLYTLYRLHTSFHIHVSEDRENIKKYKNLKYQTRYFYTSDGIKIASWYLPVKNPKAVIILIHGYKTANGGKALGLGHAEYLQQAGYSTLLIDLRSVGQSRGNKITLGVNEWKDAIAAYDYVKSLSENNNKKIGFYGISMGAVTAIVTAGETGKGDFIIASVPYASYKNLFQKQVQKEHFPVPLFLPLLRLAALFELGWNYEQYAPINQIKKIRVPIFLMSAKKDEEVLSTDPYELYRKANQPKTYWQTDTMHDIFAYKPEEFKKKVLDFLTKYVTP